MENNNFDYKRDLANHISQTCKGDVEEILKAINSYNGSIFIKRGKTVKQALAEEGIKVNDIPPYKGTDVVIVLSYGDDNTRHAIFGPFHNLYAQFRNQVLKVTPKVRFNNNLALGPGWLIMDCTQLPIIKEKLKQFNIPWTEKKFRECIEDKSLTKRRDSESNSENEPCDVKVENKNSTQNDYSGFSIKNFRNCVETTINESSSEDCEKESDKSKIVRNKYDNLEEVKSGLVFVKLPLGKNGKIVNVVIGSQNKDKPPSKKYKGTKTVTKLTSKQEAFCKKKKWRIITEKSIDKLEEYEKYEELAFELRSIIEESDDESDLSLNSDSE